MINIVEYIAIETPETSSYVVCKPSTTSNYVTFTNNSSVDESTLGQVIKNNVLVTLPIVYWE